MIAGNASSVANPEERSLAVQFLDWKNRADGITEAALGLDEPSQAECKRRDGQDHDGQHGAFRVEQEAPCRHQNE
jgi:hypothetical protein